MGLERLILYCFFATTILLTSDLHSQYGGGIAPSVPGTPAPPAIKPPPEKLRPTSPPKKPVLPPKTTPTPPPLAEAHPQPFVTKGDAKQIFSVIENQLNVLQSKNYKTAYFSYTAEAFKKATTLDEFIYFMASYPIFTNNKSSMFGSLRLKDNIVSLEGTLVSVGGESSEVKYYFIQEFGLWKIIGIEILPPSPAPPVPNPSSLPIPTPFQEIPKKPPVPLPIEGKREGTFK